MPEGQKTYSLLPSEFSGRSGCRCLSRSCFGSVDRQSQFPFGGAQMFLRLGSMAFHVVVVGGAGMLHLMNRFRHVFMNVA